MATKFSLLFQRPILARRIDPMRRSEASCASIFIPEVSDLMNRSKGQRSPALLSCFLAFV
jgi:hypothetical protein